MNRPIEWLLLLPRNICILLLVIYRKVVSPLYGDVCRYHPSCSSYTLQAFQQRGVLLGFWFGIRRILRCHPWAKGGIDDVPGRRRGPATLSRFGFVTTMSHGKG